MKKKESSKMIFIENRKKSKKTLSELYPLAEIIDLTSKGEEPYMQFSPFYPHGNIPVPYSTSIYSYSVEGIWQGLKVFKEYDIDLSKLEVQNMKGLKRTVRKFGPPLGHRLGVNGELIDYLTARKQIYLRAYAWVLDNKMQSLLEVIKTKALISDLVFLDYETNGDIDDTSTPLSHAALVKRYLEKKHPDLFTVRFNLPVSEVKKRKLRATKNSKKKDDDLRFDI